MQARYHKKIFGLYIDKDIIKKFKTMCRKQGFSLSGKVEALMRESIKKTL